MLEASEVVVPLDLTHSSYADHVVMSTADIAFIAAGAFSGFQQIAHRRAMRDQIGFGRDQAASGVDPDAIAVDFSAEQVENVANFQAYNRAPAAIADRSLGERLREANQRTLVHAGSGNDGL